MITNNMIQLKSYDKNTGNEIGNVFPITSSEAVKVDNDKNLHDKLTEINERINTVDLDLDNTIEKMKKVFNTHLVLNIKDFGAIGDGRTDDTQAFEKLLQSIKRNATVQLPMGIYVNNKEHILPNYTINFVGEGEASTFIMANVNINSFFIKPNNNNARFMNFSGICFNGNKKVDKLIIFNRSNGAKFDRCRFINHTTAALWFECDASTGGAIIYETFISRCYFRGANGNTNSNGEATETMPNYNIYLGRGATDSLITDCITINARTHIYCSGGNSIISSTHSFDYPNPQYRSDEYIKSCGECFITGNYFDNAFCGIRVLSGKQQITNNRFYWGNMDFNRNDYGGISIETKDDGKNIMITSNYFIPSSRTSESMIGYDIKTTKELNNPMIINNYSNNVKNKFYNTTHLIDLYSNNNIVGLSLVGKVGKYVALSFRKLINGVLKLRWNIQLTKAEENGNNIGSDLEVMYKDDEGNDTTITTFRRIGRVDFNKEVMMKGNLSRAYSGGQIGDSTNRWGTIYLQTAPNIESKRELKENIIDLDIKECYDNMRNLSPHKYNFKNDTDKLQRLGYILDELPSEVISDDGLDMYALITYMGGALSQAIIKIDELEERINKGL